MARNAFHGALYEFLQNNDLNTNTWDNKRAGLAKAIIHDNRYGGRLGGPIVKNKTFFFANYEARRFRQRRAGDAHRADGFAAAGHRPVHGPRRSRAIQFENRIRL